MSPAKFFVSGARSSLSYWYLRYWFDRTTRELGMHLDQIGESLLCTVYDTTLQSDV